MTFMTDIVTPIRNVLVLFSRHKHQVHEPFQIPRHVCHSVTSMSLTNSQNAKIRMLLYYRMEKDKLDICTYVYLLDWINYTAGALVATGDSVFMGFPLGPTAKLKFSVSDDIISSNLTSKFSRVTIRLEFSCKRKKKQ